MPQCHHDLPLGTQQPGNRLHRNFALLFFQMHPYRGKQYQVKSSRQLPGYLQIRKMVINPVDIEHGVTSLAFFSQFLGGFYCRDSMPLARQRGGVATRACAYIEDFAGPGWKQMEDVMMEGLEFDAFILRCQHRRVFSIAGGACHFLFHLLPLVLNTHQWRWLLLVAADCC